MKQIRTFPKAIVSRKAAHALALGHPWVYASEVLSIEPAPTDGRVAKNGDMVDVMEEGGTWQGTGMLSELSTIRVRMVSRNANDTFDEAFWRRRIAWAWQHRVATMGSYADVEPAIRPSLGTGPTPSSPAAAPRVTGNDLGCCRVIFGEADGFPGLVVDRYGPVLVAQVGTIGMECLRHVLYPLLLDVLRDAGEDVRAVYERCDSPSREKEGLARRVGWWDGPSSMANLYDGATWRNGSITIRENGIAYTIDLTGGQKTGFFLDQKYNRRAVARLASGRRVLDCFTHVGAFGLNAAGGGASYVRCVDVSQSALDLARHNARLNGFVVEGDDNIGRGDTSRAPGPLIGFSRADVLKYLPSLHSDRHMLLSEGGPFDLIILDPPAFTKSRGAVHGAMRGYREINAYAMRILPRGGYLATCSCSQHMTTKLLSEAVAEAAHSVNRQLRQVEQRQQSPDHPILWGFPQSHYLDFFIFQVV